MTEENPVKSIGDLKIKTDKEAEAPVQQTHATKETDSSMPVTVTGKVKCEKKKLSKKRAITSVTAASSSKSETSKGPVVKFDMDSGETKIPSGIPEDVMREHGDLLTSYELKEISHYSYLYFIGRNAMKFERSLLQKGGPVFDDEQGFYKYLIDDHVRYQYQVLKMIGKGQFSHVFEAYDHKTRQHVALKINRNKDYYGPFFLQEIEILENMRRCDETNSMNVVRMIDHFKFRQHVCIVFELLHISLKDLLQQNKYEGLAMNVIKDLARSLLQGLEGLAQLRVIHCDLKLSNIVLQSSKGYKVKIIDFGSSCFEFNCSYIYVQSRPYRAPEVIFRHKLSTKIDVWSYGCIVAELYTGKLLFPGSSEFDIIARIIEVLNTPPKKMIDMSSVTAKYIFENKPLYCHTIKPDGSVQPREYKSNRGKIIGRPGTKTLKAALKGCEDQQFLQLVRGCLQWDPDVRLTPKDGLKCAWFQDTIVKKEPIPQAVDDSRRIISSPSLTRALLSMEDVYFKSSFHEKYLLLAKRISQSLPPIKELPE